MQLCFLRNVPNDIFDVIIEMLTLMVIMMY